MISATGRKRVVVTNVLPTVEQGKYPAKAILNDAFTIGADVFTDGHDEVDASVFLKHAKHRLTLELPMTFVSNDRWELLLYPDKLGFYQFQVQGWVDHFKTWRKGLLKKYDAGQDIAVELQIGAQLISDAATKADAKDRKLLIKSWNELNDSIRNPQDAIALVSSDRVCAAMRRSRDKDLITVHPQVLEFECEIKRAGYSTWYELFPRSAWQQPGNHGTFKDVERLLPRVAEMGFDVLYFPPIHPIGEHKRKGKNNSLTANEDDPGSPWAIGNRLGGHKDIHPELGTLEDFRQLIQAAHSLGIEIAMDIAYQCAPDHPYVKEHPQWFKWRPDGTVQYAENPPKRYEDILPFNFETDDWRNLWRELKSVIDYWIEQGVTIFRIDNPHTKAFAFWEWMIKEVRKVNPQVLFLAEAFTRPRVMERLAKAGFNQSYTYFTWRTTKKEFEEYLTELTKTEMRYFFRPNFWVNTPDILPPHLTLGGENAHIQRLILAATLSSNYGMYGPVYEFGLTQPMPGKEEYIDNEKYELKHWDWNADTRIREMITLVNKIRRENPALQDTFNIEFAKTTNEQILCYTKTDERSGNKLIVAVNMDFFNTHWANVTLPLDKLDIDPSKPFTVHDLISGDKYQWQGPTNFVQLNPYAMPAHIFRIEDATPAPPKTVSANTHALHYRE